MTRRTHDGLFAFDIPTQVSDGQGGDEEGWTEQFQCRGSRINLRAREGVIAARLEGVQPIVVSIRRFSASSLVTGDWRMRDVRSGEEFNITSVVGSENRRDIEITAQAGVAP